MTAGVDKKGDKSVIHSSFYVLMAAEVAKKFYKSVIHSSFYM